MNLLKNISIIEEKGVIPKKCNGLAIDSRKVKQDYAFIAMRGYTTDGHKYIEDAIAKGATIIICEELPEKISEKTYYIKVEDSSESAAVVARNYYDNPSEKINIIGVTGTNGKTTIVTLLYNLFTDLGYYCGMLSTVKNMIGNKEIPATHTTPDVITLNALLAEMVKDGCEYCFMEVSSHAVVQNRIKELKFKGAVFTNLSHDHLDFHKTYKNYIEAKQCFFLDLDAEAFALTNIDDKNGVVMIQLCDAAIYTYSLNLLCDFYAKILEADIHGTKVIIDNTELWLPIPGRFNVYNQLAVYAVAQLCGVKKRKLNIAMTKLKAAEGRFQIVPNNTRKTVIVDYAHTPDALNNVLKTLKEFKSYNKIYCVFGAGGDRDKTKRPEMMEAVLNYADIAIVTSDNPRTENPQDIINDIVKNVNVADKKKVICNPDRYAAIQTALMLMDTTDITLIAGKGHEKYQDINGVKYHFDDVEIVQEILNQ